MADEMVDVKLPDGNVIQMPAKPSQEDLAKLQQIKTIAAQRAAKPAAPAKGASQQDLSADEMAAAAGKMQTSATQADKATLGALESVGKYLFGSRPKVEKPEYGKKAAEGALVGAALPWVARGLGAAAQAGGVAFPPAAPVLEPLGAALMAGGNLSNIFKLSSLGALGGGAAGATQGVNEKLGTSRATSLGTEMLAGGMAEGMVKNAPRMGGAALSLIMNHPFYAAEKLIGKTAEDKIAAATALQGKRLGKPVEGFDPTTPGKDAREAAKKYYANQDPGYAAAVKADPNLKASTHYMDEMNRNVNIEMNAGNKFSESQEAQDFLGKISVLEAKGKISRADAKDLLKKISTDQSSNPEVRRDYAEDIFNLGRQWKGDLTKTGQSAIAEHDAAAVRQGLLDAFNGWTQRVGLGRVERQYADAYAREKRGETIDHMNRIISKYDSPNMDDVKALQTLVKVEPQSKPVIQTALTEHLRNIPVDEIPGRVDKLDKMLIDNGIMSFKDLAPMRQLGTEIKRALKSGRSPLEVSSVVNAFLRRAGQASAVASVTGSNREQQQ